MNLVIFTIVLDGYPQITWHLPVFNRLRTPWRWIIVEGAAMNVKDTAWCQAQEPRLSRDGTTEYLAEISSHPRVTVIQKERWEGKTQMCNAALAGIMDPCLLMQVDADELWTSQQIDDLCGLFNSNTHYNCARFYCRYFLGTNIIATGENSYGNNPGEWLRFWRYWPTCKFVTHEPPHLQVENDHGNERCFTRDTTKAMGFVFDHWAYAFESQVAYKEKFYGYKDAVMHWRRLQKNTVWPTRLQQWLPWTDSKAMADLLYK